MSNDYFQFKQFTVKHDRCAFKVGTDGVLLGNIVDIRERSFRLLTGDGLLQVIMPVAEGKIFIEKAKEHELFCIRITHVSPTSFPAPKRMVPGFGRQKTPEFIELIKEFYLKF
ncbi:MAG: hypothetical protein WAW07_16060 [Bacteroidales bacterium]